MEENQDIVLSERDTLTVNNTIKEMLFNFKCLSLTLDNDISFQKHEELSRMINAKVFFCNPYHSWEKGGVENTNKLIREYIPKGSHINRYSKKYIQEVEDKLNNRPRKCLNYETPFEIMKKKDLFGCDDNEN